MTALASDKVLPINAISIIYVGIFGYSFCNFFELGDSVVDAIKHISEDALVDPLDDILGVDDIGDVL